MKYISYIENCFLRFSFFWLTLSILIYYAYCLEKTFIHLHDFFLIKNVYKIAKNKTAKFKEILLNYIKKQKKKKEIFVPVIYVFDKQRNCLKDLKKENFHSGFLGI